MAAGEDVASVLGAAGALMAGFVAVGDAVLVLVAVAVLVGVAVGDDEAVVDAVVLRGTSTRRSSLRGVSLPSAATADTA
jgi:hypothetical protein